VASEKRRTIIPQEDTEELKDIEI